MQVVRHLHTQLPGQQDAVVPVQDDQVPRVVLQPQPLKYLHLPDVLVVEEMGGHDNSETKTKQDDDEHSDSSRLRGLLGISGSHFSLGFKRKYSEIQTSLHWLPLF